MLDKYYGLYNREHGVGADISIKDPYIRLDCKDNGLVYIHRSLLPEVVECILKLNEEGSN